MNNSYFEIKNKQLFIKGKKINLHQEVAQALQIDNRIIYRLVVNGDNDSNRNIGALNLDGEQEWVIQKLESAMIYDYYDKMYLDDNNRLIVCNVTSVDYVVDATNGFVSYYKFHK